MEPYLSTISSKGQITIPKNLRESLQIQTGQVVVMISAKGGIILKKAEIKTESDSLSGEEWEVLKQLSMARGKRYSSGKKFLASLK
jgi:AbrB family looped-hinge helix DNA binding protein